MSVFSTFLRCLFALCLGSSVASQCHEGTTLEDTILHLPFLASFINMLKWEECFLKCITHVQCQSINYYSDNHTCHILPTNHHGNRNEMLIPALGAVYSTNPSHACNERTSPCSDVGKCIGETSLEGFRCLCMKGFSGKRCEKGMQCAY